MNTMEQKAATAGYTESMHYDYANTLNPSTLSEIVRGWLKEDTPSFDLGGLVVGDKPETAALLCKSPGLLAGRPFVEAVFAELGCSVQWLRAEGTWLDPVTRVAWVRGPARRVLLGERVALNTLARVSGVATAARRMQTMARQAGWQGQIAGTRKTTPGFRLAEKYGLLVAGVDTHRYDLSSMVMLKDNHIWSAGNITKAVQTALQVAGFSTKIEVECRSVAEALEAAGAGADIVMLDNFSPQTIHEAAQQVKDQHPSITIEASGGISESTLLQYLGPNIDVISMGSLTQGYSIVDFSLKITNDGNVPGIQYVS